MGLAINAVKEGHADALSGGNTGALMAMAKLAAHHARDRPAGAGGLLPTLGTPIASCSTLAPTPSATPRTSSSSR